jgi:hypothetical protein
MLDSLPCVCGPHYSVSADPSAVAIHLPCVQSLFYRAVQVARNTAKTLSDVFRATWTYSREYGHAGDHFSGSEWLIIV